MKIHAIQTGTVIIRPNQREGVGSGDQRFPNILNDSRWTEPLPINVWVIEHPEGIIVIDAGRVLVFVVVAMPPNTGFPR